jgi:hypothetical protein
VRRQEARRNEQPRIHGRAVFRSKSSNLSTVQRTFDFSSDKPGNQESGIMTQGALVMNAR